jgi:hypothetical protein
MFFVSILKSNPIYKLSLKKLFKKITKDYKRSNSMAYRVPHKKPLPTTVAFGWIGIFFFLKKKVMPVNFES